MRFVLRLSGSKDVAKVERRRCRFLDDGRLAPPGRVLQKDDGEDEEHAERVARQSEDPHDIEFLPVHGLSPFASSHDSHDIKRGRYLHCVRCARVAPTTIGVAHFCW
jgi:hypothetical protein